jgi:capsular exopolysaccharide synthesis family protein
MAQEFHRRVLLVDADLRRPSLHTLLGLPLGPGLSDVLLGVSTLEQALITIPEYHLSVVTAGMPSERPTELLGSTAMRKLLELLRSQFDRVLVDTPPAAPLADAGVLSRMVDGILVIVRAGRTQKQAVEQTLVEVDAQKVLGLVLNDAGGPETAAYALLYEPDAVVERRWRGALRGGARRSAAAR